ncbi:hypothetical protein [Streptococcus hyointestinalis]|uniref:hypothetical protein n=1 Tax=Streptococcus hyointestinalis TaxID=1337 RepID=UPI003CFD310F
MAISHTKVTLLCPVEKVWNKVTDLTNFAWRSDLANIKIIERSLDREVLCAWR